MYEVINEYHVRVSEIEKYFDLINNIIEKEAKLQFPDSRVQRVEPILAATLKSSAMLLLYNLVESTVTNSLESIHDEICSANIKYETASDEIRKIFVDYYYKNIKDGKFPQEGITDNILLFVNFLLNENSFQIDYSKYTKYKTGSSFSGNIDEKMIMQLALKYGFKHTPKGRYKEINTIKNRRNKLAHGELSFAECGRDVTTQRLNVIKKKTIECLDELLNNIQEYIRNKQFIRST